MSVNPRLAGRGSEPNQRRPQILSEVELLRRDLGIEMDEGDRLRARNKVLQRRLDAALSRITELEQRRRKNKARPYQLRLGCLILDLPMQTLSLNGQSVEIAQREAATLAYLFERPDTVIRSVEIARSIGGPADGGGVRTYIYRLRPKLRQIGAEGYLHARAAVWIGGGYWVSARHEQGGSL